jgi:hypothetical protein
MIPTAPANDGTVFLVRHSSDGASVNDIAVAGFFKTADLMTHLPQKLLHGLGFVLICLTSKSIKAESHVNSTNFIRYFL